MKNNLHTLILFLLCATLICLPENSHAKSEFVFDDAEEYGFSDDNRLDGSELSGLRGGLRVGALNFDFAITSKTIVDGVLQHTSTLTSAIIANNQASAILAHNQANNSTVAVNNVVNVITDGENDPVNNLVVNNDVSGGDIIGDVTGGITGDGVANNDSNDATNSDIAINDVPTVNVSSQTSNISTAVDVTVSNGSLISTIQNSNDNAIIQQINQLDLSVFNLNDFQKSNIAHQIDFQAIQVIR